MTNDFLQVFYWIVLETQLAGNQQVKIDAPVVVQPGTGSDQEQMRFWKAFNSSFHRSGINGHFLHSSLSIFIDRITISFDSIDRLRLHLCIRIQFFLPIIS